MEIVKKAEALKLREELLKSCKGKRFIDIPYSMYPGLVGAVVNVEGYVYVISNECREKHDDGSQGIGITTLPPMFVYTKFLDKPFDLFKNWDDLPVADRFNDQFIFTGEYYDMKELGDELNSVLESIEELFSDELTTEEVVSEAITRIPEGFKAMSDCVGWASSFGNLPIKMFNDPEAPELNPNWIWQKDTFEEFQVAVNQGENIRLVGPPGSGKTDFCQNYAALTGRKFCLYPINPQLELADLLGAKELEARDGVPVTEFKYGSIIEAISGPNVVLFDEPSRGSSALYLGLFQNLLDKRKIVINETGKTYFCHPDCIIVGADNSLGLGDDAEKYPTAQVQDVSTINRWQTTLHAGYMPQEQFSKLILSHVPKLAPNQAGKLAKFAALVQNAFIEGELPLTFSARQGIPIARKAVVFNDMRRAIRVTFTNTLDRESRDVVETMITSIWG